MDAEGAGAAGELAWQSPVPWAGKDLWPMADRPELKHRCIVRATRKPPVSSKATYARLPDHRCLRGCSRFLFLTEGVILQLTPLRLVSTAVVVSCAWPTS